MNNPTNNNFIDQLERNEGDNLADIWNIFLRRKKLVLISGFIVFFAFMIKLGNQKIFNSIYQGQFTLLTKDPIKGGNDKTASALESVALNNTETDIETLITFLKSPILLESLSKEFNYSTKQLVNRINISPGFLGKRLAKGILVVSLEGKDPKENTKLLNALSKTYLRASLKQRQKRISDGLAFLNDQAPSIRVTVQELQKELEEFRKKNNVTDPIEESSLIAVEQDRLTNLLVNLKANQQRLDKMTEKIESGSIRLESFKDTVQAFGSLGGPGVTIGGELNDIYMKFNSIESQLFDARSKYLPNSRFIKSLEKSLDQLRPIIKETQLKDLKSAISVNNAKITKTELNIEELNKRFDKLPLVIKGYEDILFRLNSARLNLSGLIEAKDKFQLSIAQQAVPWTVISPPTESVLIRPILSIEIIKGLILALFVGLFLGFLRDRFNYVYHDVREIKGDLKLPLLGEIPYLEDFKGVREDNRFILKDIDDQVIDNQSNNNRKELINKKRYQRFFYQESFRSLYTSIKFLNTDNPIKSLAITSSVSGEGKSLINILLAKTLSEQGLKVLQIDADLRKPQLHLRLGINNLQGLSNILTDQSLDWKECLNEVPNFSNWDVITSGLIPPDPVRLLGSQKMKSFMMELRNCNLYDLIILDVPPSLGLADSSLVSEYCDGLLFVITLKKVNKNYPLESINQIQNRRGNLLGIITNSLTENNSMEAKNYTYEAYSSYAQTEEEPDFKDDRKSSHKERIQLNIMNLIAFTKEKINEILDWLDK